MNTYGKIGGCAALALCVLLLSTATATASDYNAAPVGYQWQDARFGTQLGLLDDHDITIPIGFSFPFYGEVHNTVAVSSNGYLAFGTHGADATNDPIPSGRTPNGIVAPFWDNLNPRAGGAVTYQVFNQAPHRRLVVQWTDVPFKNARGRNTFQVILHEGTGYVVINLADTGRARLGDKHTIGIEAPSGTEGVQIDHSHDYFRNTSFLIRGPIHPFSLSPDCGKDGYYNCYDIPYEFDSLADEVGDGQPAGYQVDRNAPYEWVDIPVGNRRRVNGLGEDSTQSVPIGFQFPWYERNVSRVHITSNGLLGFGGASGLNLNVSHRLPDTRSPADLLAALWVDLSPQRGAVYTATLGQPGQRRFVVTYDGVPYYGTNNRNTFQVVLQEDGRVDLNYQVVQTGNRYYIVGHEDRTQRLGATLLRDYLAMSSRSVRLDWADARPGQGDGRTLWSGPSAYSLFGCDDGRAPVDLPFDFPFYGQDTRRLWVSTNGLIGSRKYNQCNNSLCGLRDYTPDPIPTRSIPNKILAPGWADFLPCSGGAIYFRVRGQAPNRSAVVEWNQVPNYWNLSRVSTVQIVLHESGDVDYHVEQMQVPVRRNHTIGVETADGRGGVEISHSTGDITHRSWRLTEQILAGCDANALGQPCVRENGLGLCKTGITTCVEQSVVCSEHTLPTAEVCDNADNDCNGHTDDGVGEILYADNDGDGHGDPNDSASNCGDLTGYVPLGDDCDDSDAFVHPGAQERCDNTDNDCDGDLDEGIARACSTRCEAGVETCEAGRWVDCSARAPAPEICDDVDNDCDQIVDETLRRRCSSVCGAGVEVCGGGDWSTCTAPQPSVEVCDGQDNDCNGYIDEADDCSCQYFPGDGAISAEVEWAWTGSDDNPAFSRVISTPVVGPLNDDNDDGYFDERDTPDVVFAATGADPFLGGVLRAVSGDDGSELWSFDDYKVSGFGSPALGDLDEDGDVEVVALAWRDLRHGAPQEVGLVAVDHEGELIWTNPDVGEHGRLELGSPTIANIRPDLPGNEIATCFWLVGADGETIWNQWSSLPPNHSPRGLCTPAVADLDGDGELEIAIGALAFEPDGRRMWLNAELYADWGGDYDIAPAVADLDGDGRPEVVNVRGSVYVLDGATGATVARSSIPGVGQGGPPALADIDGDGRPEILVATSTTLNAFGYETGSLRLKWSRPIEDRRSGTSSVSAFDFNGNGRAEVVHNDELYLRILDGPTGDELFRTPNWSGTGVEYPVIVDVDGDGGAEVLLARNDIDYAPGRYGEQPPGPRNGLMVLGDPSDGWVGAGTIWNQYAFHPSAIHDDGTVPESPLAPWSHRHLNAWHAAVPGSSGSLVAPDLTVEIVDIVQGANLGRWEGTDITVCPAWNRVNLRVCNLGDAQTPPGVDVGVFTGPDPDDRALATATTTTSLGAGECESVSMEFAGHADTMTVLYAQVDYAAGHGECEEGNNVASLGVVTLSRPTAEVCDQIDNDCDRFADEALTQSCTSECGVGTQTCSDGDWGECDTPEPETEICDGFDNDCDGIVDDRDACGDGGTCVCSGGVGQENCGCDFFLTVSPCGAGCALGSICGADGCEPWCNSDFDCPGGQACGDDNLCAASELTLSQQPDGPVETPMGTCSAGAQDEGLGALRFLLRR
jgi:hypothetical protein